MQIDRIWSIWLCTIYEKIETAEDDKEDEDFETKTIGKEECS